MRRNAKKQKAQVKCFNACAELSKIIDSIDEKIISKGKVANPPIVNINGKKATIAQLKKISHNAPMGKGDKTVVDLKNRKCLEVDMEKVTVQWKDVDIVLERLREELVGPARTVRAELHKVLVYRKGDFFNLHYDSKKAPNHALSLSVDTGLAQCSGGVTLFPGPCRPNDKEDAEKDWQFMGVGNYWDSKGEPGSWCAWFATQEHSVTPVNPGERVVVTYNIFVEKGNEAEKRWFTEASNKLSVLGPYVGPLVLSHMDAQTLKRVTSTCKLLYFGFGDTTSLLTAWIKTYKKNLRENLASSKRLSLGFVFGHKYSFDGKDQIPEENLRGKDLMVFTAFKRNFPNSIRTVKSVLAFEKAEDCFSNFGVFKPCVAYSNNPFTMDDFYGDEPKEVLPLPESIAQIYGRKDITLNAAQRVGMTEYESDQECSMSFWPFLSTCWLCEPDYLRGLVETMSGASTESMWGNGSTFSIYYYEDASLLIDLIPTEMTAEDPIRQEEISSSITAYNQRDYY